MNPWNENHLKTAKLCSIDETERSARVKIDSETINVPIAMSQDRLNTLVEMGGYYGITAFLNSEGNMVDYSYIDSTMLVPAEGGIAYE